MQQRRSRNLVISAALQRMAVHLARNLGNVVCLAAMCLAISDLCNQCKCHLALKVIYCKSDELIGLEDENSLTRFNLLILSHAINSSHVEYLKTIIKNVHVKELDRLRNLECRKMQYTAQMCLRNTPPPAALYKDCTCS